MSLAVNLVGRGSWLVGMLLVVLGYAIVALVHLAIATKCLVEAIKSELL